MREVVKAINDFLQQKKSTEQKFMSYYTIKITAITFLIFENIL